MATQRICDMCGSRIKPWPSKFSVTLVVDPDYILDSVDTIITKDLCLHCYRYVKKVISHKPKERIKSDDVSEDESLS